MVILQVVMFPSRSVAMPTFSSQFSKLILPFGCSLSLLLLGQGTFLEQKEIRWQKRCCAPNESKSVVLKWLRQKEVLKV